MDLDTELEAWLTLSLAPGLGNADLRALLGAFGGPQEVLGASRSALMRVVSERSATAVLTPVPRDKMQAVGLWLDDPANTLITLGDSAYPQMLLQIPDPPPVIYAKGRADLLNHAAFAIVGSRNATQQGVAHAESFAQALSDAGLTIVSGLALGIDAAAHRGGLAGASSSIAVVGTGLDIVYPARNRDLAHVLAAGGCIISEFALGTAPIATNFPRRNRVISGLARGCLVVEAALASGSLITARTANDQGKDVFAIPGSINSPLSKGCHSLIKQGAKLAETADDVLEELHLARAAPRRQEEQSPAVENDSALEALGYEPCSIDALAARSGLAAAQLATLLTQWELDGLVEALPGGRYQRIR